MMTHDPGLMAHVTSLAEARVAAAELQGQVEGLRKAWLTEHAALLEEAKAASGRVTLLEGQTRELATRAYEVTGERKPAPGVSIRLETVVEYDAAAAFEWARSTRLCLQLDRPGFEAMAKANPTICHGVRVTQEPKATLARDLTLALAAAAVLAAEPAPAPVEPAP